MFSMERQPQVSHNLHIHPQLGGRNFCTSEQARLSQGSAELGTAAGTIPTEGKGVGSAGHSQWPGWFWMPPAAPSVKEGDTRERVWQLSLVWGDEGP